MNIIAIVDDEKDIVEFLSINFKKAGFNTVEFYNGFDLLNFLRKNRVDLIILDIMLPDIDGIEICKRIKSDPNLSHIKIIMLTAKGDETDKVLGLEIGADDYVVKPFSIKEIIARTKAVLRREKSSEDSKFLDIEGDIKIDLRKFEVFVKNRKIELTSTEFRILSILARRKGWVFSREQIIKELWGSDKIIIDRAIDVHIRNLRKKLGKSGEHIKSVRGIGYKIE
uniref:Response regulator transcription factor n=1 Tax=candidate division WOR-3 bacterium TaxID=2052148 RepID=A0A7C4YIF3_UNCW3